MHIYLNIEINSVKSNIELFYNTFFYQNRWIYVWFEIYSSFLVQKQNIYFQNICQYYLLKLSLLL